MAPLTILSGGLSMSNLLLSLITREVDISARLSHLPRDGDDEDVQNPNTNLDSRSSSGPNSNSNSNSSPGQGPSGFKFPCCIIEDNDPRANYSGVWTLDGTQFSTQHITTDPRSSVSLNFTGNAMPLISEIIHSPN